MAQHGNTINPTNPAGLVPANDHGPLSLRLDERGLTPALVGGLAELTSVCAQYANDKTDRRDLHVAVGILFDVRARMARRQKVLTHA